MNREEIEARLEAVPRPLRGPQGVARVGPWSIERYGEDVFEIARRDPYVHGRRMTMVEAARLIEAFP